MCFGTFSRRARSLATFFIFARVRISGTSVPLSVTWNPCYTQKNVPWHILAPSAVACDIFQLRASAHLRHVSASFCNMEPMLQKERGQETCNASFLTPLSAYILCTTLFFMQCSLPYLFSFVKRFFNFSSSHVAFRRQISCAGVLPSRAAFMHQQPPIRFVHPDRSNRRGHENRKHCNREHKLSARQTETQRNRPDRRLYGCFRQIGDHTEQPLFFIQLRPWHTQEHACCTKQERNPDHQKRTRTSACCIPDIDRRADQHKQHDFRCQPELAKFFRQALRNLRHTFCLQHARHAHNRQKPGYRNNSFQPRFHCHQKKRQTEHQDHLHAVSDAVGTGICRVNYPLSKANGLPASQTSFLRSTPVGAEQTSTGCFAPYYLHRR